MQTHKPMFVILLLGAVFSFGACGSDTTGQTSSTGTSSSTGATAATGTGSTSTATGATLGSGTAQGTVQGQTLVPKNAASASFVSNSNILGMVLVLSNQNTYCASVAAGQTHPNHRSLGVVFATVGSDGSSNPIAAGTYPISNAAPASGGSFANAAFNATGASCNDIITGDNGAATGGTITLTSVTAAGVTGSYSLTFGSDTLTGTFTAPTCAALAAQAVNGTALTCAP